MSNQPTVVYVQPGGFDERADRHACFCCCCRCCHVKVCATVYIVLELILVGIVAGTEGRKLPDIIEKGNDAEVASIIILLIIPGVLVVLGAICAVIAMATTRPVLVWPQIIAIIFIMVCLLIRVILVIVMIIKGTDDLGSKSATLNEIAGDSNAKLNAAITKDVAQAFGGIVSVLYLLLAAIPMMIYAGALFVFCRLKRYLTEKVASEQNAGKAA